MTTEIRVNGQTISCYSRRTRGLPQTGITKAEIVEHYHQVAPRMLPHIRGRPVSIQRFPGPEGSRPILPEGHAIAFPGLD